MEKDLPNKFSSGNNMDPGEVPEELQDLTEIEEMLISKIFNIDYAMDNIDIEKM